MLYKHTNKIPLFMIFLYLDHVVPHIFQNNSKFLERSFVCTPSYAKESRIGNSSGLRQVWPKIGYLKFGSGVLQFNVKYISSTEDLFFYFFRESLTEDY